jgi:hypothetical protein
MDLEALSSKILNSSGAVHFILTTTFNCYCCQIELVRKPVVTICSANHGRDIRGAHFILTAI